MQKWEYKMVLLPNPRQDEVMNNLGNEGWELVSVTAEPDSTNDMYSNWAFFKRRK